MVTFHVGPKINPVVNAVVGIVLVVAGGIFYLVKPELIKGFLPPRNPYALVPIEELREAMEANIVTYLQSAALQEAIAQGRTHDLENAKQITLTAVRARPRYTFRTRHEFVQASREQTQYVDLEIEADIGGKARTASGEAWLSKRQWVMVDVTLHP